MLGSVPFSGKSDWKNDRTNSKITHEYFSTSGCEFPNPAISGQGPFKKEVGMIGQTISHYKILDKLGEGGMGIVYKAEDTKLGRFVALKFLPDRLRTSEQDKARFIQEAKAASSLNHPNVCTVHDIQEHDSQLFIVMEYVDGMTMRKKLEQGTMSVNDVAGYGIQIGEALQEAHSKSIVHRDIKSDNVMINAKNQIKVMDFGLAKLKGTLKLTKTSSTIGTLAYMSPEQIQGGEVDSRSDIFSFGVLLFEMLTCQMPFRGGHEAAMVYSIVNEEPDSIEKYRADVPQVLGNLIQRALEKNPADRYQSIGEMVIELRRVLKQSSKVVTKTYNISSNVQASTGDHLPTTQTVAGQSSPVSSQSRNKKPLFIGVGALVLAILAAVIYLMMFKTQESKAPAFSFQSMKITRLTSNGKARAAGISPDGKYVVYSLEDAGKQSLWVRQVATNSNVQILPPDEVVYSGITLSQDGNYVYYVFKTPSSSVSTLYQIPVLGGTPRKLLENLYGAVSISPDGKQFTFVRLYQNTGEFSLMVVGTDGSNERVLATHKGDLWFDGDPAWSPDGKVIACALGSWEGGIHHGVVSVDISDGKEKSLADRRWGFVQRLRWMPDGSGLLVTGLDTNATTGQIWQLELSDRSVTRLTNDLNSYGALSLTGDGKSLCVVQVDVTTDTYVLPNGNVDSARQVTTGKLNRGFLAWNANTQIVYVSQESGNLDLWISNIDGSDKRQLTSNPRMDFQPAVSRDGKFILFTSARSGIPNIWRMDIDGNKPKQLTGGGEDYRPDISPDGNWCVFDSWDTGPDVIMKMPVNGGTPVQISEANGVGPRISPDGALVAYVGGTTSLYVYIISSSGGKPLKMFPLPNFAETDICWTRDGKGYSYMETRNGVSNIWIQPIDGAAPRQVTKFTSDRIVAHDWSPDGKMLAVSRSSSTSDVLLMTAER